MGIHERRDREHEQRRTLILQGARDLFLNEGYERTSIRRIAERIEYSPAAIYRYFSSKEDIFFAIAETGFRLFSRSMKQVRASSDPVDTLRRRFWRYYEFSKAQPEYFALMFVDRSVPRLTREWERLAFMRETREQVSAVIAACIRSGAFPPTTDVGAVFHILAAAVHGAAVIRLSDRFIPRKTVDALARDVLETTLAGLRQGTPLSFRADVGFHGHASGTAARRRSQPTAAAKKTACFNNPSSEDIEHVS